MGLCVKSYLTCDVIIPTHNRGHLITRSLSSVLNQGQLLSRVIVVDNGTEPINLEGFDDNKLTLIRTEVGIGASAARNEGVKISTAEVVAFLDDDDYWQPGYLDSALSLFNSGADIVVGRLMRQNGNEEPEEYKLIDDSPDGLRRIYYSNPGFGGQNILVRKEFFNALGGFDAAMPASNDRDFAARALQAGAKIRVQPSSVAVLCDHSGQRVRHKQVLGNYCFLKKHWPCMSFLERFKAAKILFIRFIRSKV